MRILLALALCIASGSALAETRQSLEAIMTPQEQARLHRADAAYAQYIQAQCALEVGPPQENTLHLGTREACLKSMERLRGDDYDHLKAGLIEVRRQAKP